MNTMKKQKMPVFLLPAFFLLVLCFISCGNKPTPGTAITLDKDTSYAIGMYIAEVWSAPVRVHYDYKAFMEGFRDFSEQQESRLSSAELSEKIQAFVAMVNAEAGAANKVEGDDFLAANAQRPEITVTASGLQYEVLSEGTGPKPGPSDLVLVHYEGSFLDGTVFDSSYYYGEPVLFQLGTVISGWTEGLQLMNTGSIYRFFIPSDLGYGIWGAGDGRIPPNAALIFLVELLGVENDEDL